MFKTPFISLFWCQVSLTVAALLPLSFPTLVVAQGFPNIPRTSGQLINGPIAPEQGRTAIIAWHGERIVTVPEAPGSQNGADLYVRITDINDPANPVITTLPFTASGFNAHGYFHSGSYLYIGPHCLANDLSACNGSNNSWGDSFVINGSGTLMPNSNMARGSVETDLGLPVGAVNRSGAQSPWGAEMFWSYDAVGGDAFLAVRRSLAEFVYDWANGGALTGPAIQSRFDVLGDTGVIGMPFIMGNILIYASDQTGTGVATYDISDPTNPVLLDVLKEENPGGYWPEVYGHYVFFPRRDGEGGPGSQAGFMVVDFSDPTDLRVVADRNLPGSNQYVTFQDEFAFMNNFKIDMRTFDPVLTLATNNTTLDASQFALPVGNLVITGGYGSSGPGMAIWAHQADPDTRSPYVLYHVPANDQTNYSPLCPITLSIPETLKTETIVDGVSLILRPVGGSPVPTWHSFGQGKLLTVTPRQILQNNTTYEMILTSAIQDAAGNGLEPYTFRFSTGSNLSGGNQAPVLTSLSATPAPVLPNTPVTLNWSGNDPDLDPIEYRVDYGDGTPNSGWVTSTSLPHTYTEAGHYQVTVQVRDTLGALSARSISVTVAAPPSAPGSTASNQITQWGSSLFVVNPDNDTVTAINATTSAKLWEAPVAKHPVSIAVDGTGNLWVTCKDQDTLDVLNPADGTLVQRISLDYGNAPAGIAPSPDGSLLYVTMEAKGTLKRFNAATRLETGTLNLGASPRALAISANGTRALVTRFISGPHSGSVYDVNLSGSMSLTRTINLERDRSVDGSASGRGVPNYLAGIRISPNGDYAWLVGKKDNTIRGTFTQASTALGQDNTVRALLMLIDLAQNREDVGRRLDLDNSDSPQSVEFSALADYAFITFQGNNQVAIIDVLDFLSPNASGTIRTRWQTGSAPQGILLNATTNSLFVHNFLSRDLTVLEANDYLLNGGGVSSSTVPLVELERLHPEVLLGKQLFYHASDPRMSPEGYISCATCHVGGGHDGRTWDFTNRGEGFRNTTDLRGRSGTFHGLVHWSGNFDEIQDFENDIRNDFGGEGFLTDTEFASVQQTLGTPKAGLSTDLDALAAYVTSLGTASLPRSPQRLANGTLSADALAGQSLFQSHNCASCHTPTADYTDRQMHNVGTLKASSGNRLSGALTGIDTPTLLGLHDSAPYFHDGSAATLAEVFTEAGGTLVQAETITTRNGAYPDNVGWLALKEWHNAAFLQVDQLTSPVFEITSSLAGVGTVEFRYNSAYGTTNPTLRVNGVDQAISFTQTPNNPGWMPNEWRTVRATITYQSGNNSIQLLRNNTGGDLKIDDVLFTTPADLVTASAHVRNFTVQELNQIQAYLLTLDGSNAAAPQFADQQIPGTVGETEGTILIPNGDTEVFRAVEITNPGTGPLNIGQLHFVGNPQGASITVEPEPTILPGGTTQFQLRVPASAAGQTIQLTGWTDASLGTQQLWSFQIQNAVNTSVEDFWVFE